MFTWYVGTDSGVNAHMSLTGNTVGTRVALKRYNAQPSSAQGIETSTKKIYQWLSSELKVLGHPYLSGHENISKLRFIAWEENSLIPSLGLELASYGEAHCYFLPLMLHV